MGFFTKDKPIDCYKKVNKLISKMYYLKKTLILKANAFSDNDRSSIYSQLNDVISEYNSIIRMDFSGQYALMKQDVWIGTSVVDYECKRLSINDFMGKVSEEIDAIKRIAKGAPIRMQEINPNSIPNDFFYDEHQLGVKSSIHSFEMPPMFIV